MGVLAITRVVGHPNAQDALRLTYSEAAVLAQAEDNANYNGGLAAPVGAVVDANTYAMYRLDEVSGNALDTSGNGFDLTVAGTVSAIAHAQVGGGRQVPGTLSSGFSRVGSAGTDAVFLGEVTIEAWARWDGATGSNYLFLITYANGIGHHFFYFDVIGTDGRLRAYWNTGASATVPISLATQNSIRNNSPAVSGPVGNWYHLACRRRILSPTQAYADFFVNGKLFDSVGPVAQPHATTGGVGTWRLHQNNSPAGSGSSGVLDDVRISNMARSDAEILATYNASKYGVHVATDTGLVANTTFDIIGINPARGDSGTITVATVQDAATTTPIVTDPNGTFNYLVFGENEIAPSALPQIDSHPSTITTPRVQGGESAVPALARIDAIRPDFPPVPSVKATSPNGLNGPWNKTFKNIV